MTFVLLMSAKLLPIGDRWQQFIGKISNSL